MVKLLLPKNGENYFFCLSILLDTSWRPNALFTLTAPQNLECGSRYHVYVVAHNLVGASAPSTTAVVKTQGAAPLPSPLEQFLTANSTSVMVFPTTWVARGCHVTRFLVEYRQQLQQHWLQGESAATAVLAAGWVSSYSSTDCRVSQHLQQHWLQGESAATAALAAGWVSSYSSTGCRVSEQLQQHWLQGESASTAALTAGWVSIYSSTGCRVSAVIEISAYIFYLSYWRCDLVPLKWLLVITLVILVNFREH